MKTMNSGINMNFACIITRCALIITVAATLASFIPTQAQASAVGTVRADAANCQKSGGKDGQETHG